MTNMNGSNGQGQDHILNEVRNIDRAIDDIENNLQRLTNLQSRSLNDTDASPNSALNRELDALNTDTMTKYRGLVQRVRTIKSNPESGNPRNSAQVGKVDRRLKTAINQYQQVERDHRKKNQDQIARQYRIVRPDASDAEVREAVEDTSNQQVFSDALINSDRRGQAQSVAQNVNSRHQNIQKIEQDMMILAQLFQDLDALVVQQEAAVTNIEQKGEEVNDHVMGANTELDGAVKKARAARRKKWYCLGICRKFPHPGFGYLIELILLSAHHYHHCCCCRGGGRSHQVSTEVGSPDDRIANTLFTRNH
jgi:syntaxin 1B/2/3